MKHDNKGMNESFNQFTINPSSEVSIQHHISSTKLKHMITYWEMASSSSPHRFMVMNRWPRAWLGVILLWGFRHSICFSRQTNSVLSSIFSASGYSCIWKQSQWLFRWIQFLTQSIAVNSVCICTCTVKWGPPTITRSSRLLNLVEPLWFWGGKPVTALCSSAV